MPGGRTLSRRTGFLEVADDGSMTGWLSQGPLVGACRGPVPDLEGLRALVEAAARSRVPTPGDAPLDATIDALDVAGREHAWPEHEVVAGPWGDLLAAARTLLLDALPAMPAAAVGLAFPGPGPAAPGAPRGRTARPGARGGLGGGHPVA